MSGLSVVPGPPVVAPLDVLVAEADHRRQVAVGVGDRDELGNGVPGVHPDVTRRTGVLADTAGDRGMQHLQPHGPWQRQQEPAVAEKLPEQGVGPEPVVVRAHQIRLEPLPIRRRRSCIST